MSEMKPPTSSDQIGAGSDECKKQVSLSWLGGQRPTVASGVWWGVPWERGKVHKEDILEVRDAEGRGIAAQTWTLAYWPDGSLKWTGFAIVADAQTDGVCVRVRRDDAAAGAGDQNATKPLADERHVSKRVVVEETSDGESIRVRTGKLEAVIGRRGAALIRSMVVDGREVARDGKLVALREDRLGYESSGLLREEFFQSRVTAVEVEQAGPVRAVVRVEGVHAGGPREGKLDESGKKLAERTWLPFVVRLYFMAGLGSVRMTHTFIFDGDQTTDFIKGLGVSFEVPFREQLQNRHVRLATDGRHLFSEPVRMAPGYRAPFSPNGPAYQRAQMVGERIDDLEAMPEQDRRAILGTPTWGDFKLAQLSADGWELNKRTRPGCGWVRVTGGRRARGMGFVGDVSGGLGVSLRRFWQKYPSSIEVSGATDATARLTVWMWSPDAPAMDLRHYDTTRHWADIIYEDPRDIGRANAYGTANTSELTLFATGHTPDPEQLDAMAEAGASPARLVCSPSYYHATRTLGTWSLPETPVPGVSDAQRASAEVQLQRAFDFYQQEVERRRWYGFWDYGDFRRTYDPIRHQWMYDIGGHGWNATELMPNLWLWFAFLRTGQADIFRVAEEMTWNTAEVDVFHLGPWAGLGSRHNVTHWGCGCKEPRISMAHLKRIYYYLTTDERIGDLIREPLAVQDDSLSRMFDGHADLKPGQSYLRVGPDWQSLASDWMTQWERTGDTRYRDYLLTGMRDIGAMPNSLTDRDHFLYDPATRHLMDIGAKNRPDQFMFLFAGDQIMADLIDLVDCPSFKSAWEGLCARYIEDGRANPYYISRAAAIVARATGKQQWIDKASALYRELVHDEGKDHFTGSLTQVDGPRTTQLAMELSDGCSFTSGPAVPEAAQWALNLITVPALLADVGRINDTDVTR